MTIRGGGRPRDQRAQAHPYRPEDYASPDDQPWTSDPRQFNNGRRPRGNGGGIGGVVKFLIFAIVLGGLVLVVALTALRPVVSDAVVGWAYDNPGALRIPFVEDLVRERLGTALTEAASDDPADVTFTVREGDTISTVAQRLADQGFVSDGRAFVFQATVDDLAPRLASGDFRLARNLTPEGLVAGLINNRITIVVVQQTFRESLRIDQMTALIEQDKPLNVDATEFHEIATNPPAALLADFPWLATSGLPEGAPLEGYLAPATYDITDETTADDLVRMMLVQFVNDVGEERLGEAGFYQKLVLASIVEREAVLEDERARIAGVYQNRLNGDGAQQILNADPTVFYALDTLALRDKPISEYTAHFFWKPPGTPLADVELPEDLAGFNTYRVRGLPPRPICSPSVGSIEAALAPDTESGFRYFVAIPDGGGKHDFSKTFEEHQEKLIEYGYL